MTESQAVRLSVIVKDSERLRKIYGSEQATLDFLRSEFGPLAESLPKLRVVDFPSRWFFTSGEPSLFLKELSRNTGELVFTFEFSADADTELKTSAIGAFSELFRMQIPEYIAAGSDLPILSAEHWCPSIAATSFGNRSQADLLIGKDTLHDPAVALTGRNVNVLVFDQGIDRRAIPRNFAGGWTDGTQWPGDGAKGGHGTMIARNIIDIAPDARIFDCPLIPQAAPGLPPSIEGLPAFLGRAYAAWLQILVDIKFFDQLQIITGPWVFVNAWAVYDRRTEIQKGDYTDNPNHFFNRRVAATVAANIDVLFCAGNCGQFCPDGRCGPRDRGPRQSILGANSHASVLTVSAVRVDTMPLGYASMGPGQPHLAHDKPDLCAPSQFAEDGDVFAVNGGTSAATALAAGIVASLRQKWPSIPPATMKQVLIDSARRTEGPAWNGRIGNGIIDAHRGYELAVRTIPVA